MTGFQRVVVGVAAFLVAIRVFLPVQYVIFEGQRYLVAYWPDIRTPAGMAEPGGLRGWPVTDVITTELHVVGILVLATGVFVLFPSPDFQRLRRSPPPAALMAGWIVYFLALASGAWHYGITPIVLLITSLWDPWAIFVLRRTTILNWPATVAAVAPVIPLLWLTWVWWATRRRSQAG